MSANDFIGLADLLRTSNQGASCDQSIGTAEACVAILHEGAVGLALHLRLRDRHCVLRVLFETSSLCAGSFSSLGVTMTVVAVVLEGAVWLTNLLHLARLTMSEVLQIEVLRQTAPQRTGSRSSFGVAVAIVAILLEMRAGFTDLLNLPNAARMSDFGKRFVATDLRAISCCSVGVAAASVALFLERSVGDTDLGSPTIPVQFEAVLQRTRGSCSFLVTEAIVAILSIPECRIGHADLFLCLLLYWNSTANTTPILGHTESQCAGCVLAIRGATTDVAIVLERASRCAVVSRLSSLAIPIGFGNTQPASARGQLSVSTARTPIATVRIPEPRSRLTALLLADLTHLSKECRIHIDKAIHFGTSSGGSVGIARAGVTTVLCLEIFPWCTFPGLALLTAWRRDDRFVPLDAHLPGARRQHAISAARTPITVILKPRAWLAYLRRFPLGQSDPFALFLGTRHCLSVWATEARIALLRVHKLRAGLTFLLLLLLLR